MCEICLCWASGLCKYANIWTKRIPRVLYVWVAVADGALGVVGVVPSMFGVYWLCLPSFGCSNGPSSMAWEVHVW